MLIFESSVHLRHHSIELDGGRIIASWDTPLRVQYVLDALELAGPRHQLMPPSDADTALLEGIHRPDYLHFLATAWDRYVAEGGEGPAALPFCWPARRMASVAPTVLRGQLGYYSFAVDCGIGAGTWEAALESAAIAQSAAEAVVEGAPVAFGLCRPPGHHASADQFGGYCYLNNAAVAAEHLRAEGAARVAIIDIDYHHGNGTQDIFYARSDVLYFSIHADPLTDFPFFLGHSDEKGAGLGEGCNLNLPLPRGTTFHTWAAALRRCIAEMTAAGCDALVVSLGVDAHEDDPISRFKLTTEDLRSAGRMLGASGLPTVYVLEGGYASPALGHNVVAVLDGHEDALA